MNYLTQYLNQDAVKTAIHAHSGVTWAMCSDFVGPRYNGTDVDAPMMPVYDLIFQQAAGDFKAMVYSGDNDAICATYGSQQWIWDMGYNISKDWASYKVDGQVAGFTV